MGLIGLFRENESALACLDDLGGSGKYLGQEPRTLPMVISGVKDSRNRRLAGARDQREGVDL